ncbi:hypothetical protein ACFZAM_33455 [Streptomyces sp. NPDC008079]|uniref:hypothetical protein n=1 Tax=Streptomyces sp. NPDC008079 TaxID=3364806 RepID=UPI0036E13264
MRTDAQAGVGSALNAGQRTRLLGMLAQLPPPADTGSLLDIVAEVRGRPTQGTVQAPRAWHDPRLLYDIRRGTAKLEAVLRYAVYVASTGPGSPAADGIELALVPRPVPATADPKKD